MQKLRTTSQYKEKEANCACLCARNTIFLPMQVAGVSPLLGLDAATGTRERPADVLLCRAQDINTGGGAAVGRVALDIRIICPQAAGHLDRAAGERLGAAEEYVKTKCGRGDMERRCVVSVFCCV